MKKEKKKWFLGLLTRSLVFLSAGLSPKTVVAERLATMCVLPLVLAGVLGSPSKHEQLTEYLRNLLVQTTVQEDEPGKLNADIVNSVRFLWFVPCSTFVWFIELMVWFSLFDVDHFYDAAHLKNIIT